MKEKSIYYDYCHEDIKVNNYKAHHNTNHASHRIKCGENGCILRFENKCGVQLHIEERHPYSR